MAVDLVIDVDNKPGALAELAQAISDAGVNIAAATCVGPGETAELHILVKHAEPGRCDTHSARSRIWRSVASARSSSWRWTIEPGVLADLARKIARAGIDLDLVYIATRNRVVFGAPDLDALREALGVEA